MKTDAKSLKYGVQPLSVVLGNGKRYVKPE